MFVLKPTCRKGLHPMIGDSYRLETFKSRNGTRYEVRRCRACQSDRFKAWYEKRKNSMAHPEDQGRCLLDSYFECPAKVPEACICAKMPPNMARELAKKKYGQKQEETRGQDPV